MAPETIEKDEKKEITEDVAKTDSKPVENASVPQAEKIAAAEESAAEENTAAPKKGISKLAVAIIVALSAVIITSVALIIVMLAGSGANYTEADIGSYAAVAAEKDDVTVDVSGLFDSGFSIELRNRGRCKINLNGEVISGKWSCIDTRLAVSGGGFTYSGYVSDGVMLLENLMNEGISLTLKTDAVSTELLTGRAGKYYIDSFTVNEQMYEGSMLDSVGFGDWYIELDESGSGKALMFSAEESELIWSNDSICCTSGLIIPYTYDDEGIISLDYAGMSAVTFKNDDALDPFTDEGLAGTLSTDTLEVGSLWSGTLSISNHSGEGTLADGVRPVYGFLCKDSAGGNFFEVYETSTRSGTPIISYWVNIDGNSLVPVIGELDGWIFDYWLTANDASVLQMTLENNTLNLIYLYNWQEETCSMNLSLSYAGME